MAQKPFTSVDGFAAGEGATETTVILANGDVTTNNITVANSANLGTVGNLVVLGGANGQVLTTDGLGNLSWTTVTSGGGGGANVIVDDFTGNGVQTTFTLSVTPANVSQTIVNYNGATLLRDAYYLDGANIVFDNAPANGSFIEVSTFESGNITVTGISNGTSNIAISGTNGNVNTSVNGNANILVVHSTGTKVNGTLSVTGNANVGNISGASGNFTTISGSLTTAAQPNVTSLGTLTSLTVGPNSSVNLSGTSGYVKANSIHGLDGTAAVYPYYSNVAGAVGVRTDLTVGAGGTGNLIANTGKAIFGDAGNVAITGGTNGYVLSTDGAGNLSWIAQTSAYGNSNVATFLASYGSNTITTTGNVSVGNLIGTFANGNSTIAIPAANGNINLNAGGSATPELIVTTTGANVNGTLSVSGNVTGGNVSVSGSVVANGITLGYLGAPLSGSDKVTSYTLATPTDLGKIVTVGSGGSIVIPNSTFSAGDTIGLYNNTSANVTVTCSTTNAYIAGTDTNKTSVTLATRGIATIVFISSTLCVISGSIS